MSKELLFNVIYRVKKELREKVISSTWKEVEAKTTKVSKRWVEVILMDKSGGLEYNERTK